MGRRIALVGLAALVALPQAMAQPTEPDIEMEPGDAGSGSTAPTPAPPPPPDDAPPAPVVVPKDPKLAKKLQTTAQQLEKKGDYSTRKNKPDEAKGHYEAALNAYTKAVELADDAGVLAMRYELGIVLDKLGKHDLAAIQMRTVVKAQTAIKPDILKKATAKYDELSMKIGLVTLTVNTEGATISLNGVEIAKSPLPEPLVFMPGTYTLSFAADGYQPKDSEIKVEEGSETERAIELEPIKIVVTPITTEPEPTVPDVKPKEPSLLPVYVGGGLTVALGVTGIITGIMAKSQHSTYVAGDSTKVERDDAKANGETLANVTDVLLISAVAAGGFTAYWYFFKYKPAKRKQGEQPSGPGRRAPNAPDISKVDVVPWVQTTGGGFSVLGSF
ncbi:MAG: PEGA domain-containing protein [Deltaproteobacteria bacterium]|nr:PEGA domain-containing protein [Deltaproteobacteria bacterium]